MRDLLLPLGFVLAFIFDVFVIDFMFNFQSDLRQFVVIGIWLVICNVFGLGGRGTFILSFFILVILTPFTIFSPDNPKTDRIATYLYLFLWVGLIQSGWELYKKKGKKSRKITKK